MNYESKKRDKKDIDALNQDIRLIICCRGSTSYSRDIHVKIYGGRRLSRCGRVYVRVIIEYAKQNKIKALNVYQKNLSAIHLYGRMGFEYIITVDLGYESMD